MASEEKKIIPQPGPPGTLGKKDLLMLAVGQTIGAGVISLIGPGIATTGYSVWLSYVLAMVFGLFLALPYLFMASSLRFNGGIYSVIHALVGERLAGAYLVGQIPGFVGVASFCISLSNYVVSVFPNINPRLVSFGVLTLFVLFHCFGVNVMAKLQNYMGYALIIGLCLFIGIGLPKIDPVIFNTATESFMTNGMDGLITAMFSFSYSTYGYYLTINFGKDAKNARRDVPWAMLMAIPIITFIYVGCAMVGVGVIPLDVSSGQPLTYAAQKVLPGFLFVVFMVCGVGGALLTTLNSSIAYRANVAAKGAEDGWLPGFFSKRNRYGAPIFVLLLIYVVACLPIIFNFPVNKVTNNINLFYSMLTFITFIAFYKLPTKFPEAWAKSRFHMPNGYYYAVITVCLCAQIAVFVMSIRSIGPTAATVSIVAMLAAFIYGILRHKSGKIQEKEPNVWSE